MADNGYESGYESDNDKKPSTTTLKKLYESNNYPSKKRLYKLQRDANLGYTQKQVNAFVDKQEVYQITAQRKKQKVFNTVTAPKVGSNLMIDLVIYDRFKIHNYQYILNCIDIKSRKAYGVALTKKDEKTVTKALLKVFKDGYGGHVPEELQMDNGGEFTGQYFQDTMKKAGVKTLWYSEVGDIRKQSVIERFNRTLSEMLQKWREGTRERTWYKVLDKMYEMYNNTEHGTMKATPNDVWNKKDTNHQDIIEIIEDFKPGDRVRIKIHKKVFDKGDAIKFSRELYMIKARKGQKWVLINGEGKELARRYTGDELRLANEVEETEIEDKQTKTKKLDDQIKEVKTEKRVKKELNNLKTNGDSQFLDSVKEVTGRRTRSSQSKALKQLETNGDSQFLKSVSEITGKRQRKPRKI